MILSRDVEWIGAGVNRYFSRFKSFDIKKSSVTCAFVVLILLTTFSFRQNQEVDRRKAVDDWYCRKLDTLQSAMLRLESMSRAKASQGDLKQQFLRMRLSFKRLSILTDYFNIYHTKLWNGPAIPRIEDDSPHRIIEPHGFQKLEEIIWEDGEVDQPAVLEEMKYLLSVVDVLKAEPDRVNKFRNPEMWDAFRQHLVRLSSLGISGFDSPVALLSIDEADAGLSGLLELTELYSPELCCDRAALLRKLKKEIADSRSFLKAAKSFDSFDRLTFLREYINPLADRYRLLTDTLGYQLPAGRRSLNQSAGNIFAKAAFDINFYSPNQRYQVTDERIVLGKKLFSDKRLSGTGTRSCASCHQPSKAFTDGLPKALSLDNVNSVGRNTPTLWNAAFQTKQFYDSRQTMLEFQVSDVVHNVQEMKGKLDAIAQTMTGDTAYLEFFRKAYPADAVPVSAFTIANAVSSYIRSLTSFDSKFDRYIRKESAQFSASEKNGFNLFMGKAKCGTCHFTPLFNGLTPPQFSESESEVLGVPESTGKPAKLDQDSGKYKFSHATVHLFAFKTPTLRNIALTAPYMHNGIYRTLEEVVDFYNDGGGAGLGIAPENQTLPTDKLNLTKKEKKDLVLFMKTLTDTSTLKKVIR
ncbi:cytochrome-c peroxidase [Pollutibacter soli]|uniref:cytochrome-c peroxidase n=1 Tax=Pollutibacter soli TaxID=3034157 RepID=UPI003013F7A0